MKTKMGWFVHTYRFGLLALGLLWGLPAAHSAPPAKVKPKAEPAARVAKSKPAKRAKTAKTAMQRLQDREKKHRQYLTIMEKELQRNARQLKTFPRPKVYSLQYRMRISKGITLQASDGQIMAAKDNRKTPLRMLDVDVRVGDHSFDQTGKDGHDWRVYQSLLPGTQYCPKELTPMILRSMLWKQTDWKYNVATAQYWRKSYVRSTKPNVFDKAGDYSKEPPTVYMAPLQPELKLDKKRWKGILRRITSISKNVPDIVNAGATLRMWEEVVLGVGLDGSRVRLRTWGYNWSLHMKYLGKSKEFVNASDSGYARTLDQLPSEAQLKQKFIDLWKKLKARTESPEGDPDDGPAIVDPALAGAIFYDILMVRLEANRFIQRTDPRIFANQMGKQIIPSFLTVIDNPLLKNFNGTPLSSHYLFDDEWVPARRLVMIKDGVLKNFYLSRKPYKQFKRSNGHGRNAFGTPPFSRPGLAIVKSKREYSPEELKERLIALAKKQGKQYAYILKRFSGYSNVRNSIYTVTPEEVHRIDVNTGKSTLVKGLQVRTAALQVVRGIIGTGKDYTVFNGSDGENSGDIQISTIAPSLLIQRLVFHRVSLPEKKDFEIPPPFKPASYQDVQPTTKKAAATCPKQCPEICRRCPACQKKKK